jgi:predicted alpha/beta superfamily hydrolase
LNASSEDYQKPEIKEHSIKSRFINQTFTIKVQQPMRRADNSESFKVVYTTDADFYFDGFATIANHLQLHGETPRFILVGIGYEDSRASALLRMRDFYLHGVRKLYCTVITQLADSPLGDGVKDLDAITHSTCAIEFLRFISEELIPYINANYATLSGEDTYCGYSAGASFGLYTLFSQPEVFKRYILGSPATSYSGQHWGVELAEPFIQSRRPMDAKVYLCVGEFEEFKRGFGDFELVTGYYRLAKLLKQAAIPGLDLTTQVFPQETHATAWCPMFIHGLKTLLGAVDQVPFWPQYLK